MKTFRLLLTMLLSFAILSVGSANAAMLGYKACPLQQMQVHDQKVEMPEMAGMKDCMEMAKATSAKHDSIPKSNDPCKSGQVCAVFNVLTAVPDFQIRFPQDTYVYISERIAIQPSQFVPDTSPFGLWRPPQHA